MTGDVDFVDVTRDGRTVRIEHQWVGNAGAAPLVVFLHEGLGSRALWKDFPARLCAAAGCRGLVYSRPGYGRSTPRAPAERWAPDFMHRQAYELLPDLFAALGVDAAAAPPWLFGHSDGGSIVLLFAARYPNRCAGLIVVSPHIFVEEVTLASIARARETYERTDLRERLARYHDDPDSAFHGWNEAWLDPAFRDWTIAAELDAIACPVLAVQGVDDEYGTLEQIRGIARRAPQTELLELPDCGHSAQRDQPDVLIRAAARFIAAHDPAARGLAGAG